MGVLRNADARRSAWRFGRLAETLAAARLRLKGYRILARGFKVPVGEIDIVARRGNVLAFVEVKARGRHGDAEGAEGEVLGARQRRRIERAAGAFLARYGGLGGLDLRFDLVEVAPWRWPRHVLNAWIEGE